MRRLLPALALVLATAGCAGDDAGARDQVETGPSTEAASSPAPSSSAPAPIPPAPERGACHRLAFADATAATSTRRPVPCRRPHTAVTIRVGRFDPVVDGRLLAVDSAAVQRQVRAGCRGRLGPWTGGSREQRRLSRLAVVWFSPTLEQAQAGADWFRCDLVVPGEGRLARFTGTLRGVLARGGLDAFGRCATADPAERRSRRVLCRERHAWRAVATIDIPRGAAYDGAAARTTVRTRCRGIAEDRAADTLRFRSSFEWPSRADWRDGRRYAYCWLPD